MTISLAGWSRPLSCGKNKNLKARRDVWQASFVDRRVRDSLEYAKFKDYIWQNPVKRRLARTPEEYPYSSAYPSFRGSMDPVPQRLKPISLSALPQGLKTCSTPVAAPLTALPVVVTTAGHFSARPLATGFAFSDYPMSRSPDHQICAGGLDRKQFLYLLAQNSFDPTLSQTPRKDGRLHPVGNLICTIPTS
jgi:hypothetical protein